MIAFSIPAFLRDSLLGASTAAILLILFACWKHVQDWRAGHTRAKWFLIMWSGVIITTAVILKLLYRIPFVNPTADSWWYLVGLTLLTIGVLGIVRTWNQKEPP